jgi:cephalosporin hydroxylase
MNNEPDFNRDRWEGQMNPSERELLYRLVLREKPEVVCEVGTCRGGGSTYFIAKALQANGKGKLYTCESCREFYDYARKLYAEHPDFEGLEQYVNFYFGDSYEVFQSGQKSGATLLGMKSPVDIVLLDGGIDSIKMLYDFAMFRPFIPIGKWLVMHDWNNGKSDYIKPFIEHDPDWEPIQQEIGLVIYKRIDDIHGENFDTNGVTK